MTTYNISWLGSPEEAANLLVQIANSGEQCVTFVHSGPSASRRTTVEARDAASFLANYFQPMRPERARDGTYHPMTQEETFQAIGDVLRRAGVDRTVDAVVEIDTYNARPNTGQCRTGDANSALIS